MPIQPPTVPARILLAMLRFYKFALSPLLHGITRLIAPAATQCRFLPTCSEYAHQAIEIHGAGYGSWLTIQRLLRCHPFSRGGADPVPLPGPCPSNHVQSRPSDFPPQHLP